MGRASRQQAMGIESSSLVPRNLEHYKKRKGVGADLQLPVNSSRTNRQEAQETSFPKPRAPSLSLDAS